MKEELEEFGKKIIKNWNSIILWIAVLGAMIVFLYPGSRDKVEFYVAFMFMGGIALVFTLLDIRAKLQDILKPPRRDSMDDAEEDLISSLKKESLKLLTKKPLEVKVVGGRLRNIRRILVQLFTDVTRRNEKLGEVHFSIYHIDPNVLEDWPNPNTYDTETFRKNNEHQASVLRANIAELKKWSEKLPVVTFDFIPYSSPPVFWGFLIGNAYLIFGFFIWLFDVGEFQGPQNPCYSIPKSHDLFNDLAEWYDNRCTLFNLETKSAKK